MAFTCPFCHATSHNPKDEKNRYCGRCHVFVDDELARRKLFDGRSLIQESEIPDHAQKRHMIFQRTVQRLAELAYRGIHVQNLKPDEFVVVCILVDTKWRSLVDVLMPGQDWQPIRDRGEEPVALGSALWSICERLAERLPSVRDALLERPGEGLIKAIALDENGGTVYEIAPMPELYS